MVPYIVGHYIYNLWGGPWNDNQAIVRPNRLTPFGGARNDVKILRERYYLPTKQDRYHCYMVGQVANYTFNIMPETDWLDRGYWYNLADYVRDTGIIYTFYTNSGIVIPLTHVYYTVTEEKNLVFIIKEDKTINWDMDNEHVYFRSYKSLLQTTLQTKTKRYTVDVFYKKVKNNLDKNEILIKFREYLGNTTNINNGKMYCYVNGVFHSNLINVVLKENDVVEIVYDTSLEKVIELQLSSLNIFQSIKDGIRKYLFSHSYFSNKFEYYDDIDFYVCIYNKNNTLLKGVYIHRNDKSNIRQVTNCDYSISVNQIEEYMFTHSDWLDVFIGKVVIRAYYRKQPEVKYTPFVMNRLHELNKLPYRNRVSALLGYRSNVTEWRADVLENSLLMDLVTNDRPICTIEDVRDVYGYNALAYYTGYGLHYRDEFYNDGTNELFVDTPYAIRKYSSIFEYDKEGKLLGWYRHGDFSKYKIHDKNNCYYIEFIAQVGTRQPNDFFSANTTKTKPGSDDNFSLGTDDLSKDGIIVDNDWEYRVYACDRYEVQDYTKWRDVTDDPTKTMHYIDNDGNTRVKFLLDNSNYDIGMLRTDRDFLVREVNINITNGVLKFRLNQWVDINTHANGMNDTNSYPVERQVLVPYGQMDIFLNGHALVEGVDYFQDFPYIYITNKEFLNKDSVTQKILYRMMSFCNADMSPISYRYIGYVNNGQLSRNNKFDIKDEKNLLFKIGGGVFAKEVLGFAEDNSVIINKTNENLALLLEGRPYEIRDIIVPKRDTYPGDTYIERDKSLEIDKRIEDYLSQFIKDTKFPNNPAINGEYRLFSPVLSNIIDLAINNKLDFNKIHTSYTDQELIEYVENKIGNLFDFDPFFKDDYVNKNNCAIEPYWKDTVQTVSFYQYNFIKRVIRVYYREEIEISHFLNIGED